ncbi:MAG: hypothetical protein R3A44_39150 [Caldilineaceae bacterium]
MVAAGDSVLAQFRQFSSCLAIMARDQMGLNRRQLDSVDSMSIYLMSAYDYVAGGMQFEVRTLDRIAQCVVPPGSRWLSVPAIFLTALLSTLSIYPALALPSRTGSKNISACSTC